MILNHFSYVTSNMREIHVTRFRFLLHSFWNFLPWCEFPGIHFPHRNQCTTFRCTMWSSLRWHHPVVFYQTNDYFISGITQLYKSCIITFIQLYYMFRLYMSAIIRQKYWFTKKSKRAEVSPDKQWV